MAQESRHQTDPIRRRSAFPELIDEQEGPRGAAAHHLGHLQEGDRAVGADSVKPASARKQCSASPRVADDILSSGLPSNALVGVVPYPL